MPVQAFKLPNKLLWSDKIPFVKGRLHYNNTSTIKESLRQQRDKGTMELRGPIFLERLEKQRGN